MKKIHDPRKLLESLCAHPKETNWIEFKENRFDEDSVGKYVSALANSAMLEEQDMAYLVFGVRDSDHSIVGTTVDLIEATIGSETFMFWLNKYLEPHINIQAIPFDYGKMHIEMLCIEPGYMQPVKFKRNAYVRIASCQQPLSNYPERERALWQITSRYSFESSTLNTHMSSSDVIDFFDCESFLKNIGSIGKTTAERLSYLERLKLIKNDLQGRYEIVTLLAIISARDLDAFSLLHNKGVRLIVYKGKDKLSTSEDICGRKGYIIAFSAILSNIMSRIPSNEIMEHGVRKKIYAIPEISVREFLGNAIVHQDFTEAGSRVTVEIFKDKIKITNPGLPLVSIDRFIDTPSRTRNPKLAEFMRNAGLVEQRGSGVDRAIFEIEKASLPPPLIEAVEGSTIVNIFMRKNFADLSSEERVRASFQHACVCYEANNLMSIGSLRSRFGLPPKQTPLVLTIVREAINLKRIRPVSDSLEDIHARFVPYYAL